MRNYSNQFETLSGWVHRDIVEFTASGDDDNPRIIVTSARRNDAMTYIGIQYAGYMRSAVLNDDEVALLVRMLLGIAPETLTQE